MSARGGGEATGVAQTHAQRLLMARMLRAAMLLVSGIVIAFTATLHRDATFDRWVLFASLLAIGLTTLIEFFALRVTPASWLVAVRATAAMVAGVAVLFSQTAFDIAVTVAVWALISVLIATLRASQGSQPWSVGAPSALLSGALALLVMVFRNDLIAIIGFFGAYAIVRGVFLAISAFDTHGTAVVDPNETVPGDESFAPAN
ncbi:hypothetical protein ACR5KS_04615 [Leucobacter sp. W1153]|uniref:hypothetical protein n=1 Tax=Leucobacter sp. W1153 TaxID=3439064 RepID=UPI003F392C92